MCARHHRGDREYSKAKCLSHEKSKHRDKQSLDIHTPAAIQERRLSFVDFERNEA